jgi:hypothetical protein
MPSDKPLSRADRDAREIIAMLRKDDTTGDGAEAVGAITREFDALTKAGFCSIVAMILSLNVRSCQAIRSLRARIAELEQRPALAYRGIWQQRREYQAGSLVTDKGAMWLALESTDTRPPGPSWKLTAKAAR